MASPTFQAVGAISTTSTLSPAAACPVTTTTGRLIIWCFFGSGGNYTGVTPPAGFTARINTTMGTTSVVRVCIATKTGVSGDSGTTFTGSATGSAGGSGKLVLVYDNYDSTFAGTWAITTANQGTMSTTSVVLSALTTNINDATLLGFFMNMGSLSATFTPDALMTERLDASVSVGVLEVADEARPTAGSTGTRTAVPSASTANWATIGMQLPGTAAGDVTPPTVPTGVAGTSVANPVITWTASTDAVGVTQYNVKRSTTVGGTYSQVGTVTGTPPTTTYTDTTVTPGTQYFYKVSAQDAAANVSADSTASAAVNVPALTTTYSQTTHRGRNDDGSETTATWKATAGTDWTQAVDTNFRVRFNINGATAAPTQNTAFVLRYSLNGGAYTAVSGTSSVVRAFASANIADGVATTEQLAGAGTFNAGTIDEVDGSALGFTAATATGQDTEVEYSVQIRSVDVVDGDTVALRVYRGTTALDTYTDWPIITVSEPDVTPPATPTGLTLSTSYQ